MRNSPWFLLLMTASTVTLAGVALLRPSVGQVAGSHQNSSNLLQEWRFKGPVTTEAAAKVKSPLKIRNRILQGLHIKLHVEDEAGGPIQGASVVCDRFLTNSSGRVDAGSSNREGDFASTRLVRGDYEVQVNMPGYLPSGPQYWTLPTDGGAPKTIRLTRASTLKGTLQGFDGIPQNHGILLMTAQDGAQEIQLEVNSEGAFCFTQFPAGAWALSWKTHTAGDQDDALQKTVHLTVDEALELLIILPAEMLYAPSQDPQKDVGIYSVESN